jgi:hypothetical protein
MGYITFYTNIKHLETTNKAFAEMYIYIQTAKNNHKRVERCLWRFPGNDKILIHHYPSKRKKMSIFLPVVWIFLTWRYSRITLNNPYDSESKIQWRMVWSMVLLGILNTSANPTAPRPIDSYCTGKLGESSFAAKTPTSNRCKLLPKFRNNCVNEPSFVPATVGTLAETVELVAGWNWLWSHGLQRPGSCQ